MCPPIRHSAPVNEYSSSQLAAAMADVADERIVCNAEGAVRRFILSGMRYEAIPKGGEPLEHFVLYGDKQIADDAQRMLDAKLTYDMVNRKYSHHIAQCEACQITSRYHRSMREI
jgi:hypothetical protein